MKFAKPMILPSIPTPVFMFLVFLMRTSKLCFFFLCVVFKQNKKYYLSIESKSSSFNSSIEKGLEGGGGTSLISSSFSLVISV